ncbi:MAG: DUF2723 domain-containing protein [Myxococcota bacterium]|nr:DUF2723 domain-containing protein [Myxococcota bacterium]
MKRSEQSDESSGQRWPAVAAFGLLLLCYVMTMSRSLLFFDTGELALVGAQMGLGHPPGQPIYTLVLALLSVIFPEHKLIAMNGFSALTAALCVFPAHRLMRLLGAKQAWIRFGSLMAVGLCFPVWEQGTRIELYAASTLLMLWVAALGCEGILARTLDTRRWLVLGGLVGLGVGFNPVLVGAAGLGVGLAAIPRLMDIHWWQPIKSAAVAFVGSLGGIGISLIYLVWVGGQHGLFVWGQPDSLSAFRFYISGADYAHTEHTAWSQFTTHFSDWLAWLTDYGTSPLVLVGLGALMAIPQLRQRWPLWALPCFIGAAFTFTYGVYFPDVPDFNGYLMPFIWWCGVGCARVCHQAPSVVGRLAIGGLVGCVLAGTWMNHTPDRSHNRLALDIARIWLDNIPTNGILLAEADHIVFPMMYVQTVEQYRPDVVVINVGFAASAWYWQDIFETHPALTRIALQPQARGARLRQFLLANRSRSMFAENIEIAGAVGIRPCPATWGLALGRQCTKTTDEPTAFNRHMARWWATPARHDHISRRVLAALGAARGTALLALGEPRSALNALKAGMPKSMGQSLKVPSTIPPTIQHWPLPAGKLLIGDPDHNRALGQSLLRAHGFDGPLAWLP